MNETTNELMKDYAFGIEVRMRDPDGPIAIGHIVPKDAAVQGSIEGAKPIVQVQFGDPEGRVQFFGPDGNVLIDDSSGSLPPDDVIAETLNTAWTGDKDSDLMPKVQMAMMHTVNHMLVAHQTSQATGVSAQTLFHSMSIHDKGGMNSKIYVAPSPADGSPVTPEGAL